MNPAKCPRCMKSLNDKGECPYAEPDCWKCHRIHHGLLSNGLLFHEDCPSCELFLNDSVPEPPLRTCVPIDPTKGEWRCRCVPDPDFDTSANPSFFSHCNKCDTSRPPKRSFTIRQRILYKFSWIAYRMHLQLEKWIKSI